MIPQSGTPSRKKSTLTFLKRGLTQIPQIRRFPAD